jgi:hypothetical protein
MRGSKEDVPVTAEIEEFVSQQAEWGQMNVEIASAPAGLDSAPLFKGLPDDRCQCPHWGYMVKGRMRINYADHEEILKAGDAFYMEPGHTTIVEEDAELVRFSPKGEYQKTMEVAGRNFEAMQEHISS